MKTYNSIHDAYLGVLADVYDNYEFRASPRGLPIREKLNYQFTINFPKSEAILTRDDARNKVIASYTQKETELYDSKTNKVEDFTKASKFWGQIANPDNTINSAYGHLIWEKRSHGNKRFEPLYLSKQDELGYDYRMRTPWEWAKESLVADKDTRQAILRFSLPEHAWQGNKDFPCTTHGIFFIRENQLHFCVNMRSNDLVLGLVYDLPWFVSLMDKMVEELRPHYSDIIKGTYTHVVHSLHIYEKNEEMILKMLGRK